MVFINIVFSSGFDIDKSNIDELETLVMEENDSKLQVPWSGSNMICAPHSEQIISNLQNNDADFNENSFSHSNMDGHKKRRAAALKKFKNLEEIASINKSLTDAIINRGKSIRKASEALKQQRRQRAEQTNALIKIMEVIESELSQVQDISAELEEYLNSNDQKEL